MAIKKELITDYQQPLRIYGSYSSATNLSAWLPAPSHKQQKPIHFYIPATAAETYEDHPILQVSYISHILGFLDPRLPPEKGYLTWINP